MSYIILRGRWCDIIVLNVHAPTEDKINNMKDRLYENLEQVFDKFRKHPMIILLGDFNAKVGREDIFKQTIWNESSHQISNHSVVRVVIFARSKNLIVKSTMFPRRNINKFTWTSGLPTKIMFVFLIYISMLLVQLILFGLICWL
jgi:exonuclease III